MGQATQIEASRTLRQRQLFIGCAHLVGKAGNNLKGKIVLRPGSPDDDNREYLPEEIKGSDIVVNENGNNSQPYPERLIEYTEEILGDGRPDVWCEYVPETYDPSKKTPLVFSMHGGLMTGWGQAIYTSWTLVADREGFICVFPNGSDKRAWKIELTEESRRDLEAMAKIHPEFDFGPPLSAERVIDDNRDIRLVFALMDRMKKKYNIDEGRVFMQGMSMGNAITSQFARNFGHLLAGAAGAGGPTSVEILYDQNGNIRNRSGHLAIWQSHPELNGVPGEAAVPEQEITRLNREYWLRINRCNVLPEISIRGENNFAFYQGEKADVVYLDIKNRDHGQTFDDAELVWDYLFSGTKREPDGSIVRMEPICPRTGDRFAVAVAKDCRKAWFHNRVVNMKRPAILWQKLKYHGLYGEFKVRGEYLCVPLSFLAEVFEAEYLPSHDTLSAVLQLKDGRILQFARGSIGCVVDNRVESMLCEALNRDGDLYVPFRWFCQSLFNLHVSECSGVVYATDHDAWLSADMALLISNILRS
jgi:poly(3-hydroxybutyrate) depolymerase